MRLRWYKSKGARGRLLVAALAAVLVVGVAGCGGGDNGSGASGGGAASGKHYKFAIVQILNDPFFNSVFLGAKQEAKKLDPGISVQLTGPSSSEVDPSEQIATVKSLTTSGVDGIGVAPADAQAIVPAVKQAMTTGIPVVDYNLSIADPGSVISNVLTDNGAGGETAGKYLCKAMGNKGAAFIAEAHPGNPALSDRWSGFTKAMKAGCPAVQVSGEIVGCEPSQATGTISSAIVKNRQLVGFYADSQCTADTLVKALERTGRASNAHVVAFDATPSEVQYLQQGKVDALVAQRGIEQGARVVDFLWRHIHNQSVPKQVMMGTILMTKSNFAETKKYAYPAEGGQG